MASETKVPKFFKPFAHIIGFTFFMCIYAFFSGFFSSYTVSQLTSIAKQFNMGTDRIGSLTSSSEIGYIIATVFTGHFFSRLHRPRILFAMGCINGLACCVAVIPYLLDLRYDPNSLRFTASNDTGVCDATREVAQCQFVGSSNRQQLNDLVYGIFILAAFMVGVATSGVWTIGVTYVDDNSDPKKSSMYLGIIFFVRLLSPVGALLVGGGFSAFPLHLRENGLTPADDSWVAAWWLGYVTIGVINIIVGIPLLFFPKHMSDDVTSASDDVTKMGEKLNTKDDNPSFCQLLKEFPRVIGRLLCNPVLMFMIFGLTIEVAISVSYPIFIPLYFEVYFHVSAYTANLIMGFTVAAAAALGVLIGGCATTFIRLSLNKLAAIAAISDLSATLLFLVTLLINCDSGKMAGVNTPGAMNLSQPCNMNCACDDSLFYPVCGSDGVSYPSPCHAGCPDLTGGLYPNCTCVESGLGSAVAGQCVSTCDQSLMAYGVLLFIVAVVLSAATIPAYMIHLRCVRKEDKTMAVGLSNMISSIVLLPLPILFGMNLEQACLLYPSASCVGGAGYCSFYDNEQLKYRLHLMAFVGRLFPPLLYGLGLFAARNLTFAGDAQLKDESRKVDGVDNPALEVDAVTTRL